MKQILMLGGGFVEVEDDLYEHLRDYDWFYGEEGGVFTYGRDLLNEGWIDGKIAVGMYSIEEMSQFYRDSQNTKT